MEFTLFERFAELSVKDWVLFASLLVVFVGVLIYVVRKNKSGTSKKMTTQEIAYGAIAISLAFVLSYIKLFRLPQGGSITPASMLPIMVYAYWYGPRDGLIAGLAYALLQMIQDPYFIHPAQVLLDYLLAFTVLGTAGFFKNLFVGIVFAGVARMLCSFVSGAIFFAEYAPAGMNAWLYSLGYQASTILPDVGVCVLVAALLYGTIKRLKPVKSVKPANA